MSKTPERTTIKVLKDGYWDRAAMVRLPDGELRVRKESHNPGPWAVTALRNEIRYLESLPEHVQPFFPEVLECWDDGDAVGYEMPWFADYRDAGAALPEMDAHRFQQAVAACLFGTVYEPMRGEPSLAMHVETVIREACCELEADFPRVVTGDSLRVNGEVHRGLDRLRRELNYAPLDQVSVRLHGDLILENILWREDGAVLFIDPVSVAGVSVGHPLFDLAKYESYASGELFAIREELVDVAIDGADLRLTIEWGDPRLRAFRERDLCGVFRAAYERRHGAVDARTFALLDGYFSLVMARNTRGKHQQARVVKAVQCLNAAVA